MAFLIANFRASHARPSRLSAAGRRPKAGARQQRAAPRLTVPRRWLPPSAPGADGAAPEAEAGELDRLAGQLASASPAQLKAFVLEVEERLKEGRAPPEEARGTAVVEARFEEVWRAATAAAEQKSAALLDFLLSLWFRTAYDLQQSQAEAEEAAHLAEVAEKAARQAGRAIMEGSDAYCAQAMRLIDAYGEVHEAKQLLQAAEQRAEESAEAEAAARAALAAERLRAAQLLAKLSELAGTDGAGAGLEAGEQPVLEGRTAGGA